MPGTQGIMLPISIKSYNAAFAFKDGDYGHEHRRNQVQVQEVPEDEALNQRPLSSLYCIRGEGMKKYKLAVIKITARI